MRTSPICHGSGALPDCKQHMMDLTEIMPSVVFSSWLGAAIADSSPAVFLFFLSNVFSVAHPVCFSPAALFSSFFLLFCLSFCVSAGSVHAV